MSAVVIDFPLVPVIPTMLILGLTEDTTRAKSDASMTTGTLCLCASLIYIESSGTPAALTTISTFLKSLKSCFSSTYLMSYFLSKAIDAFRYSASFKSVTVNIAPASAKNFVTCIPLPKIPSPMTVIFFPLKNAE